MAKPGKDRYIAVKAYCDAKHNMTTAQVENAVAQQEARVNKVKDELEEQQQVLIGYRRSLVERKGQ